MGGSNQLIAVATAAHKKRLCGRKRMSILLDAVSVLSLRVRANRGEER